MKEEKRFEGQSAHAIYEACSLEGRGRQGEGFSDCVEAKRLELRDLIFTLSSCLPVTGTGELAYRHVCICPGAQSWGLSGCEVLNTCSSPGEHPRVRSCDCTVMSPAKLVGSGQEPLDGLEGKPLL